jgi:hypothetical protein
MTQIMLTQWSYIGPQTRAGRRHFSIQGKLADFNDSAIMWDIGRSLGIGPRESAVLTDYQIEYENAATPPVTIRSGMTDNSRPGTVSIDLDQIIVTLATKDWIGLHGLRLPIPRDGRLELVIDGYGATDDIAVQLSGWIE